MTSLKQLILEEEEYSIPGTEFASAGESFCVRGAKTKGLTPEQLQTVRDVMSDNPTSKQEEKIKEIIIKSLIGQICNDAGKIANRYKQHGITRDDLISVGIEKMLKLTWPRIDWKRDTTPQTFIMAEMRGHMTNAANKEVKKKGLSGVGDQSRVSTMSLDAPISGKEGDDMTAYDIIGGSFDNETEEADFMERLYRYLKSKIKPGTKTSDNKLRSLENFMGIEDDEYTGYSLSRKELADELGINHASIHAWQQDWSEILKQLKQSRPELFSEYRKK
jgi:DNA-directed RNA polymerase specialized sigma subunit